MVGFKRMTMNRAMEIVQEFGYESTAAFIRPEDAEKMKETYPDNVYVVYDEESNTGWISFLNKSGKVLEYEVREEVEGEGVEDFTVEEVGGGVEMVDVFDSVECEEVSREYFEDVKYEVNALVVVSDLVLNIPEGFEKKLNSIEKSKLLNDQLLQKSLQLDNRVFTDSDGKVVQRIVEASKKAKHIEMKYDISNRLNEYLEKFHA